MIGSLHDLQPEESSSLDDLAQGYQLIGFDWRYLYVNNAIAAQSGRTKAELLGFTITEKNPGIERTELFSVLKKSMIRRESRCVEDELHLPDGTSLWLEFHIDPVPEGLFILSIDITQKKKAEKEKREYIAGLEHIVNMASHKMKLPVTQIVSISNMLEHAANSKDELKQIGSSLKKTAIELDIFNRELEEFIQSIGQKQKPGKEK